MRARCLAAACLLSLFAFSGGAQADENYFGYSYGSETLPAGRNEAYLWWTQRTGKGAGDYRANDVQLEYEHGWTDTFQTSFYLTGRAYDYSGGAIVDEETGEAKTLDRNLDFDGVKASMKWSLRSPERNGYGLALYLEPEYLTQHRPDGERFKEVGIETKLILQKNFLDGRSSPPTTSLSNPSGSAKTTRGSRSCTSKTAWARPTASHRTGSPASKRAWTWPIPNTARANSGPGTSARPCTTAARSTGPR
jgi:hypothetical protein